MDFFSKCANIKFPKYFKYKLENNIRLFVIRDKRFPVITGMFIFKNGSVCDSYNGKNLFGLSSLTSELLIKGTNKYSATDIANLVESGGAYIISGCDYDFSYLNFHSLKNKFEKNYSLVGHLLRESAFNEEEIERLRIQKINTIKANSDLGEYLSRKIFQRRVYGKSLYGIDTDGTLNSLKEIKRNDVLQFYKSFFLPNNLLIALVGDISIDKAIKLTEEFFSDWNGSKIPEIKIFPQNVIKDVSILIVPRKGAVQSNITIGHKGVSKSCNDLIKIKIMNTLLGGSFISRINKSLREIHGFTYFAFSEFNSRKYQGDFYVETSVDKEHTALAIKEIIKELKRIKSTYVTDEELINVKNYVIGNYPLQIETSEAVATKVLKLELYGLRDDYYNTLISKICEVDKKDIYDVANKYIDTENLVITVVGSLPDIRKPIEKIAKVEIIKDTNNF